MTVAPPTTPPTVAHDSTTCDRGRDGARCLMCQFAYKVESGQAAVPERIWLTLPYYHPLRDSLRIVHEAVPVGANIEYRLVGVRDMETAMDQPTKPVMERGASLDEARRRESSDRGFESRLNPHPDNTDRGFSGSATALAYAAIEQSAATIRARRWYMATMNDCVFIINEQPHPAPVDYVNPNAPAPSVIISMHSGSRKAQDIAENVIAAHNRELGMPVDLEQSAAIVRARRAALLERATPDALTEGALALAEAHLHEESWFNELPNDAAQDEAIADLASQVEYAVDSQLARRRYQHEHERERRLREDG